MFWSFTQVRRLKWEGKSSLQSVLYFKHWKKKYYTCLSPWRNWLARSAVKRKQERMKGLPTPLRKQPKGWWFKPTRGRLIYFFLLTVPAGHNPLLH